MSQAMRSKLGSLAAIVCLWAMAASVVAQVPGADKLKDALDKGQKKLKGEEPSAEGTPADAPGSGARILFSAAPIDPAKPENLATSFKAGSHIYALVQVEKTWRELLAKGNKSANEVQVPIDMLIDGKDVDFQYITIKKPAALDTKFLVLDIAPEPDKMTAYKDPGFFHGAGKGKRKIGPDQYTYNLGELESGKHTIRFQVRSYGDVFSAGEFTIEGESYKFYAELREKLLAEAFKVATMPEAQKVDKELEATMRKLLENAGWKDIRKLVIVDKDWWLNRAEGGDSPIVSRHIAAAAAAKADDGSYYWCICTFHQQKRLDGSFGSLELTKVGEKKPIAEENIDK